MALVRSKMDRYKLHDTKLVVFQGMNQNGTMDISNIRTLVMEDFYKNTESRLLAQREELDSLHSVLAAFSGSGQVDARMGQEMKVLFPEVRTISLSKSLQLNVDSARTDTLTFAIVGCGKKPSHTEKNKMGQWLKARIGTEKLQLILLD